MLFSDLLQTVYTVETQQEKIVIPDDFHHGFIKLLHIEGHMINDDGVCLRHLCDWAVYVNRVAMEWFRSQLEDIGLWTFASQLTAVCSRYLGLPEQSWAREDDEKFLNAFIEIVLAAGNFGNKEAGGRSTLTLEKCSFAKMTKQRYPWTKGILLPSFMLVNVMRYGWLLVSGKRKAIRPSTFARAKRRNKLHKQFRLFEV